MTTAGRHGDAAVFFFLCGAARALGDLAQKGSNYRVLSRNCRQMDFVVHLKGLPTLTIRHLDLLHVKSMQILSTCSRVLFFHCFLFVLQCVLYLMFTVI